jgi:hypothetical protein
MTEWTALVSDSCMSKASSTGLTRQFGAGHRANGHRGGAAHPTGDQGLFAQASPGGQPDQKSFGGRHKQVDLATFNDVEGAGGVAALEQHVSAGEMACGQLHGRQSVVGACVRPSTRAAATRQMLRSPGED